MVTWAADCFATPIVAATRVAGGWVFVVNDGTAARGATFPGVLEPLGSLPRRSDPIARR